MAEKKNEVVEQAQKSADMVVNNAFVDALSVQLKEKEKYGLTYPPDYNPTNALMGAYLMLKETNDKNNKCVLQSCSQPSNLTEDKEYIVVGFDGDCIQVENDLGMPVQVGIDISHGNDCTGNLLNPYGEYVVNFARNHGLSISEAYEQPMVKARLDYFNQTGR